jgi:tetratricopeptide (TPR) repeat protein
VKESLKPITVILFLFIGSFSACSQTEQPGPSASPDITSTQPPAHSEVLLPAWQSYENEDYQTARLLAEEVRQDAEAAGDDNTEATALIGLSEFQLGQGGTALFYFEQAEQQGYQNPQMTEAQVAIYTDYIQSLITDLYTTFHPGEIKADIHKAQDYLSKLELVDPASSQLKEFSAFLRPTPLNIGDYANSDLTRSQIEAIFDELNDEELEFLDEEFALFLYDRYPSNPLAMYFYGVMMMYKQNYPEALDLISSSLEEEPGNIGAWMYLGFVYENLGLFEHARAAYINCLIMDLEHEAAYRQLDSIRSWRGYWFDNSFGGMGFTITHSFYDDFTTFGSRNPSEGAMQTAEDFIQIRVTWQIVPEASQTTDFLKNLMIDSLGTIRYRLVGSFNAFDYAKVPMIYQNYVFFTENNSDYANAVIIGGYCGDSVYMVDFQNTDDSYDRRDMHWIMAVYLETFSCDELNSEEIASPSLLTPALLSPKTSLLSGVGDAEPNREPIQTIDISTLCRQYVDSIQSVQISFGPFEYDYADESISPSNSEFDVNKYFSVLGHIYVEEGYYMGHLYFSDLAGAKPMLYTVKLGYGPFAHYDDYIKHLGEVIQWEASFTSLSHANDYLRHIKVDEKSEDGYIQYVLLALLGDQFHLAWHALYNDTIVICNPSDLVLVEKTIDDFDAKIDPDLLAQALELDLTPTIRINEDTVEVRLVVFSKWGGYAEVIYIMDRFDPYYLIDVQWNTLIEYDCGIRF